MKKFTRNNLRIFLHLEKKIKSLGLLDLKQVPKQRHEKFYNVLLSSGFKINECDKYVYVKNKDRGYIMLCLYVDDMINVDSNDNIIRSTTNMLNSKFDMKDMGL